MWEQALLTAEEMGRADVLAQAAGVSSLALMENAGGAVVRNIRRRFPPQAVAVLCGPGNNGGDGLVVARLLKDMGWPVRVALLGPRDALTGDAAANAARWSDDVLPLSPWVLDGTTLVVDALFGAGLARAVEGAAAETLRALADKNLACVAIDIPSGVDSDTGAIRGIAPTASLTVTFFRRKPGHLLFPGRERCGEVAVEDIGIPDTVLRDIQPKTSVNDPELWLDALPRPAWSDNKYRRGNAVIVGGDIMTGAARLAAQGARRVGAGYAMIAAPARALSVYAVGAPGVVVVPLRSGTRGETDFRKLVRDPRRNAVLVGPGNGVGNTTRRRVLEALRTRRTAVLDADALTSFAGRRRELARAVRGQCVMTPHEGEFARLFGIKGDKLLRTRLAAAAVGAILVLKGPDTVVAAPDGRAVINGNAPPTLATAGSGDVLSGVVLGLLAQGMDPFRAAAAAVWLHGEAARGLGIGLIAEDIPEALPGVIRRLLAPIEG